MKLIVFDCDGTIADSQHAIVAAMNETFAAEGMAPPPRDAVLEVVGLSLAEAIHGLRPELDPGRIAAMAERYGDIAARLRAHSAHAEPLFPGAREALSTLAARSDVVLGIATGKSRRGVNMLFEREDLHPLFATIQTADTHPSKPDPSMLFAAMAEVGVTPDNALMVGDSLHDAVMARRAGVPFLGVAWGYHAPSVLEAAGAKAIVRAFSDIEAVIDQVFSAIETAR